MEDQTEYNLLVAFPDESVSFVTGFEAGQIWQRIREGGEKEFTQVTHTENREVIQRLAVAASWTATPTPTEIDGWDTTEFIKITTPILRVVK